MKRKRNSSTPVFIPQPAWGKIELYKQLLENTGAYNLRKVQPSDYVISLFDPIERKVRYERYLRWMKDIEPRRLYDDGGWFWLLHRTWRREREDAYEIFKRIAVDHIKMMIRKLPKADHATIINFLKLNFLNAASIQSPSSDALEDIATLVEMMLRHLASQPPKTASSNLVAWRNVNHSEVQYIIKKIMQLYVRGQIWAGDIMNKNAAAAASARYPSRALKTLGWLATAFPKDAQRVYGFALLDLITERHYDRPGTIQGYAQTYIPPEKLKTWIDPIIHTAVRRIQGSEKSTFLRNVFTWILDRTVTIRNRGGYPGRYSIPAADKDLITWTGHLVLKLDKTFPHAVDIFALVLKLEDPALTMWFLNTFRTIETHASFLELLRANDAKLLAHFASLHPIDVNKSFLVHGKKTTYMTVALKAKAHRSVKFLVNAGFDAFDVRANKRPPRYKTNGNVSNIESNDNNNTKNNFNRLRTLRRTKTRKNLIERLKKKHPHVIQRLSNW